MKSRLAKMLKTGNEQQEEDNNEETKEKEEDNDITFDITTNKKMNPTFPQFNELGDDLCRYVLTFLAEAPLEETTTKQNNNNSNSSSSNHRRPIKKQSWFSRNHNKKRSSEDNNNTDDTSLLYSELTSSLPYVNKQFYIWSNLDDYWKAALVRQLQKQTNTNDGEGGISHWKEGLKRLLNSNTNDDDDNNNNSTKKHRFNSITSGHITVIFGYNNNNNKDNEENEIEQEEEINTLIESVVVATSQKRKNNTTTSDEVATVAAASAVSNINSNTTTTTNNNNNNSSTVPVSIYKDIYRKIIKHHIRFEGPIFLMPCHLQIGEMYGLHLFEPRYRIMIRELMDNYCSNPNEAKRGEPIIPKRHPIDNIDLPPYFLHACNGGSQRLGPGDIVCLVEVVLCRIYDYGSADVQLLPITWVQLEKVWVQPSYGHLFYGKAIRT